MIPYISIKNFSYELPDERIAKYPLPQRDASKLLVYKNKQISEATFAQLPDLLPAGTLLVFNNTKVIRARMKFRRITGAVIEVFCLEPCEPSDYQLSFAAQYECSWRCTVGHLKRWKDDTLLQNFTHRGVQHVLRAEKLSVPDNGGVLVRFSWDLPLSFGEVLELCGVLPIPPYLHRPTEQSDYERYQTVYSRYEGSVAAPTAGLHFTQDLISRLKNKGIDTAELTLHVGAGTFKPVKTETIGEHEMHAEHFSINVNELQKIQKNIGKIVAVGTTTVRCLESLMIIANNLLENSELKTHISQWKPYEKITFLPSPTLVDNLVNYMVNNGLTSISASTQILLAPPYKFNLINGMITNFHQPQSTLLLLVAAIVGDRWRNIYRYALDHDFRFLSYGDGGLLMSTN
jgi:S-adenosylmethionine:tRNA ribosyltransferase-isomerase